MQHQLHQNSVKDLILFKFYTVSREPVPECTIFGFANWFRNSNVLNNTYGTVAYIIPVIATARV